MPITAKCLISAVGKPLKVIFRGSQLKRKTPPFLYNNLLNGFTKKKTRWRLNNIFYKGLAGHP
jgi:hypothetical protein